jgi:hypothetical protein
VDQVLPRIDQLGRPVGDVFNLHPEYSRIFVGGFPVAGDDKPRIQVKIRNRIFFIHTPNFSNNASYK